MSFFNQIGRSMGLPSRSAKPRAQPQPVVLERPWGDAPVPAPHKPLYLCPVSYTHLTLPTIYSV